MRLILISFVAVAIAVPSVAQQSGDSDRDYGINGQGFSLPSPAPVTVPNCAGCGGWLNEYLTGDPGASVAWIIGTEGQIGWFTTATNSVDIGPAGLDVILDGTNPNDPLAANWTTDVNGNFSIGIQVDPVLHGASAYFAMLHFAASSPDGFWLSQTHQMSLDPTNALGPAQYTSSGTTLNLGDDDSQLVNIGFTFKFYGVSYTQCFVNSNGSVTFGAGDTWFASSASSLASGPRRAAVWGADLDPGNGGQVRYETNIYGSIGSSSNFTVSWHNVPQYSWPGGTGSNSFSLTLHRAISAYVGGQTDYDVIFDYASFTSQYGLVGISPGGTTLSAPTPVALDLSAASNLLSSSLAFCYYEQFDPSTNPIDLYGHRIDFDLDSSGYPTTQL